MNERRTASRPPGPSGATSPFDPIVHIVLDRPKIAGNIGAIVRLAAATGAALHVCGPLPFHGNDPHMRRAGLDYWADARVHFHQSLDRCLALLGRPPWVVEVGGTQRPWDVRISRGDVVVLGPEDGSVPAELCEDRARLLTLPTRPQMRSMNLAQCTAVVVFEAIRQNMSGTSSP